MPFGEPSNPSAFIQETLRNHDRRLNDLERQQYLVIYDPLNNSGDAFGRTLVEGNLFPICGISAFGLAIYDDASGTWRQVNGGQTLPDVYHNVVALLFAVNGSQFVRIDTTGAGYPFAVVLAPVPPFIPGHPPSWGASIVAGSNPLAFQCNQNITLALSSFPAYGDATVHLVSAAALGPTGDVFIHPQAGGHGAIVTYTGISGNDLTGCTWIGTATGWSGPALGIQGSTQHFDTPTGPQHILITGIGTGFFFEYEPVNNVWVRVASLGGAGTDLFYPPEYPTASAPAWVVGAMYFDTTLNKLRIGGAAGWETVTSV